MLNLSHRTVGYAYLQGAGLEIGALHEPAKLPKDLKVEYLDAIDEHDAARLFPEIPPEQFVHVSYKADLDAQSLSQFPPGRFDFVVINHVLEHLSNPIKTVRDVFRAVRPGGKAVIAIPDKEYTFDRHRRLTPFYHLWQDYLTDTRVSDDAHFEDFLRSAAPHVFQEPPENLAIHIERARSRREHAHVWTTATFREFLFETMNRLRIEARLVFESPAAENQIEYFSVWERR